MIKMNIPVIFQFLKDLSANNNRDWFNEHRAEYETARVEFENFLATVIARISLFDERTPLFKGSMYNSVNFSYRIKCFLSTGIMIRSQSIIALNNIIWV